ncbi:MAG: FAD-dependent monooxygenase [Xanthomonadales bacterium]|nr:FAD-dependent monooxygenase [Xanthomonadales bacterium]ODU94263.1 MAG: hypothetical protein ABT18_03725 [Rhodanobacter sp. SCN 66-43]OJY86870.1 MAG: hypothetical protein BGP23_11860 [Xanthomonadales bacterium 66-474]
MQHPFRVLVIGAGIAGPALALLLHKAGVEVELHEAYPQSGGAGGVLTLAPNGMHVLRELGLGDRVTASGCAIAQFEFRTHKGRRLGAMSYGTPAHPNDVAISIARETLHFILLEALRDAGIAVHWNRQLERIEQDAQGATAFFGDGTRDSGHALVGADGIRSRVREHVLPDAPKPSFTGLVGYGGVVPREAMDADDAIDSDLMTLCFGNARFLGYAPYGDAKDGGMGWWSALPSAAPLDADTLRTLGDAANLRRLLETGRGWFGPVPGLLEHTIRCLAFNLFDMPSLPRWSRERVGLIGDAAHAMSPHSGQGASMALEDALVLGTVLQHHRDAPQQAFAEFERVRRGRVERAIALGRRSGDAKNKGALAAWLQTRLMPLFLHLGRHSMDWIYDYRPRNDSGSRVFAGDGLGPTA